MKKNIFILAIFLNSCSVSNKENISENKDLRIEIGNCIEIEKLSIITRNEKMIKSLKNGNYCHYYFPIKIKNKSNKSMFFADSNSILYNKSHFKYENESSYDVGIIRCWNREEYRKSNFDILPPKHSKTYYLPISSSNNYIGKKRNHLIVKVLVSYLHEEKEPKKNKYNKSMKKFVLYFYKKPNGEFRYIKNEDTLLTKDIPFYFYNKHILMN